MTLTYIHRWNDGSSLKTSVRDGYYTRSMWATQLRFATGTTASNFSPSTGVTRTNNAKAGEEHHTFLQTDYLTNTRWLGLNNHILVGAEYVVENSSRSTCPSLSRVLPFKPDTTVGNPDSTAVSGNLTR